ncbi:MAG: histidinol-phosphatase [Acidimicrobiales bacterium]
MIDYHVHLWSHGAVADEGELGLERITRYTDQAAAMGVGEIALTEHLFRFVQGRAAVDRWWQDAAGPPALRAQVEAYFDHHATADLDRYMEMVLLAKQAGLPVVAGLEVDYYPGMMERVSQLLAGYPFDVLLGSVHWIGNWMFDVLSDSVQMAEWDRRPVDDSWQAYTAALEELAGTGACDVLAHPDLIKLAHRVPDRGIVAECEERIAEAAASSGMAAEVSSAGMLRPCREDYPSPSLLRRFAGKGVPITLASDAHGHARVGERNDELQLAITGAGYRSVRRFRARKPEDLVLATAEMTGDPEQQPRSDRIESNGADR